MQRELAYALVTPYTIRKSRTGAVLSRLLGQVSCDLVAAQMFATSQELAEAHARSIHPVSDSYLESSRELIRKYIRDQFAPAPDGRRHRTMLLVFYGENAVADVLRVAGHLRISDVHGESIRDTFGDLVFNPDGSVRYFEPAVVVADTAEAARRELRLWLEFARRQPPILEKIYEHDEPDRVQKTLVLIKPDSWQQKSSRPGAIVDMFSRTGLRIIGCKLCHMSVAQALEFYGPVEEALRRKLAPGIGVRSRNLLEENLGMVLPPGSEDRLTKLVGVPYAEAQFERIVEFMCGMRPSQCPPQQLEAPGTAGCIALVYEGVSAVEKIRAVLGPTDPTKAPSGTVRREFGSDVMVNTAHASEWPRVTW
jgi:nucleoside diphosphate kinase